MNRSELLAQRDLRQACFHEAGHEAVVFRFGGVGDVRISPNERASIDGTERAWFGQFRIMGSPGEVEIDEELRKRLGMVAPPANWRRLVGLAGLVAECMADGVREPWEIVESIEGWFEEGVVSATDAELIGAAWNEADVSAVVALLDERWGNLEERVSQLESRAKE